MIAYKAPIPLTLFGYAAACYNRPALLLAVDTYVTVTDQPKHSQSRVPPPQLVKAIANELKVSEDHIARFNVDSELDISSGPVTAAYIVAVTASTMHGQTSIPPAHEAVQQKAYAIEKAYFRRYSHAQTVAALQGGLVFYRKEFEFYKTVFRLPMKLPEDFLSGYSLHQRPPTNQPPNQLPDYDQAQLEASEKRLKRAVIAIQTEDQPAWQQAMEAELKADTLSQLTLKPGSPANEIKEAHEGLQGV